jgi:hypothetical protein
MHSKETGVGAETSPVGWIFECGSLASVSSKTPDHVTGVSPRGLPPVRDERISAHRARLA